MLSAPVIADVTIRSTTAIKGAEAVGVAPGHQRFYVEADIGALLRGAGGLPARVGYLFDAATDARGRAPKLRKMRVLIYARRVPNAPDQLQLVAPDAQLPDPGYRAAQPCDRTRCPVTRCTAGHHRRRQCLYVPGTLPGEGETQIFLTTAKNRPVSLSVLRHREERRWAVALSEIVDEAAAPPARDTLLWYRRLAPCPNHCPNTARHRYRPKMRRRRAKTINM